MRWEKSWNHCIEKYFARLFVAGCFLLMLSPPIEAGEEISVTWTSSVDGAILYGTLWLPDGYDPNGAPVPLLVYFNGGTGGLQWNRDVTEELDRRGWIGLVIAGREWSLESKNGCTFPYSMVYLNHPDPDLGPGRQDVLDGIEWALSGYRIDADRVYVMGFSLGGRGAYMIGLHAPHYFAGIAPLAPATDMFEVDIRTPTYRQSYPCRMAIAGGIPGTSDSSATLRSMQSARFLLENAYNLPIFHGHGTQDRLASNTLNSAPYMHGRHILTDTGFDACHACSAANAQAPCMDSNLEFCFGHTPTLSELRAAFPDGYDFAWMMTPVGHRVDGAWLRGAPIGEAEGVEDPQNAGRLLGAFEFLARHRRNLSPETVVYKSYSDLMRRAYWLEIAITTPWQNRPGAIRAMRDSANNSLTVELVRVDSVFFDLEAAGVQLTAERPLSLTLNLLDEPAFDPALQPDGESAAPVVALRDDFSAVQSVSVLANGEALAPEKVSLKTDRLYLGPIDMSQKVTLDVRAVTTTGLEQNRDKIPERFGLLQNYPNPFNPGTTIAYELTSPGHVVLRIFDVQGREVRMLVNKKHTAGSYSLSWDGRDDSAKNVACGVYILHMRVENSVQTAKLVLIR